MPEDDLLGDGREAADRAPGAHSTTEDRPVEAPDEDTAEQRADAWRDETDEDAAPAETPDDVDPADRAEQNRAVAYDDDEYR